MGFLRLLSIARWRGLNQFHSALVPCLLILGLTLDPTLADSASNSDFPRPEVRTLRLGQERNAEKLPFRRGGKCVYELMDMKEAHWYEVKISYPASIPAIFSIDLLPQHDEDSTSSGRRLLNTEKIIFHLPKDVQDGMKRRVLVSVRPEGFVAQSNVQEQSFIIYNILLEEVVLGIPLQAFWVGFLGLVALCASVFAARQISIHLQPLMQQLTTKCTKREL